MNQAKFDSIADLQTGYSFRSGLVELNKGESGVPVVQLRDIQADGSIHLGSLSQTKDDGFKDIHSLKQGDLVFRSRGQWLTMGVVPALDSEIILAAPLIKLRLDRTVVLPEYIAWYINSPAGQSVLAALAENSTVKMVSKSALADMVIPIPSMDAQISIADLMRLSTLEKQLSEALLTKRAQLFNARIQRYLQEV